MSNIFYIRQVSVKHKGNNYSKYFSYYYLSLSIEIKKTYIRIKYKKTQ